MTELIFGVIVAVLIIGITRLFSKYFSAQLIAATILVAIAFIYVGYALKGNPTWYIVVEVTFALVLYFVALIGYTRQHSLIAYGIILHGVWDILHHNNFLISTSVPPYWPPFCLVVDLIDGIYFLVVFKALKKSTSSFTLKPQV